MDARLESFRTSGRSAWPFTAAALEASGSAASGSAASGSAASGSAASGSAASRSTKSSTSAVSGAVGGGQRRTDLLASTLANHGFTHTPTSSDPLRLTCFFCESTLPGSAWAPGFKAGTARSGGCLDTSNVSSPLAVHAQRQPSCEFAQMWLGVESFIKAVADAPSTMPAGTSHAQALAAIVAAHPPHMHPRSKEMIQARAKTFGSFWPHKSDKSKLAPIRMAEAGMFHSPMDDGHDTCRCAYCSMDLDGWTASDDPRVEHAKRHADCLYFTLPDPPADAATAAVAVPEPSGGGETDAGNHDDVWMPDASLVATKGKAAKSAKPKASAETGAGRRGKRAVRVEPDSASEHEMDTDADAELPKPVAAAPKQKAAAKSAKTAKATKAAKRTKAAVPVTADSEAEEDEAKSSDADKALVRRPSFQIVIPRKPSLTGEASRRDSSSSSGTAISTSSAAAEEKENVAEDAETAHPKRRGRQTKDKATKAGTAKRGNARVAAAADDHDDVDMDGDTGMADADAASEARSAKKASIKRAAKPVSAAAAETKTQVRRGRAARTAAAAAAVAEDGSDVSGTAVDDGGRDPADAIPSIDGSAVSAGSELSELGGVQRHSSQQDARGGQAGSLRLSEEQQAMALQVAAECMDAPLGEFLVRMRGLVVAWHGETQRALLEAYDCESASLVAVE